MTRAQVMSGQVNAQAALRFAREAEIAAPVQHPSLVSAVDLGVAESRTLFLAVALRRAAESPP